MTANETQNTDLFWALRGGGGNSYGVTTSWTIKVTPKLSSASVMSFNLTSGINFTADTLWQAIRTYFLNVPTYNAAGNYVRNRLLSPFFSLLSFVSYSLLRHLITFPVYLSGLSRVREHHIDKSDRNTIRFYLPVMKSTLASVPGSPQT